MRALQLPEPMAEADVVGAAVLGVLGRIESETAELEVCEACGCLCAPWERCPGCSVPSADVTLDLGRDIYAIVVGVQTARRTTCPTCSCLIRRGERCPGCASNTVMAMRSQFGA